MMKIHNFEQQSPEWFEIRKGKMTASHAQAIAANGKGLETYIAQIMAEYFSTAQKEFYTNADIERGIELEEYAREMYELTRENTVEEVGFIEHNPYSGCSPDGLVGKEGGIEIKSLNDVNHFNILLAGERAIESKYMWQMQMNLLITERKWWDYISYNPNFKESLQVFRITPVEQKQEKLRVGLQRGEEIIKGILQKMQ